MATITVFKRMLGLAACSLLSVVVCGAADIQPSLQPSESPGSAEVKDTTRLFMTSFIVADLYRSKQAPGRARELLQQYARAYDTPEREVLYSYLMSRLSESKTELVGELHDKRGQTPVDKELETFLMHLANASDEEILADAQHLNEASARTSRAAEVSECVRMALEYRRFIAMKNMSPDARVMQAEKLEERVREARAIGSALIKFVSSEGRYPQSLSEIPGLAAGVGERYVYRAGKAQDVKSNEPVAMENAGPSSEEAIVIYGDGHFTVIRGQLEIEKQKNAYFK